MVRASPRSPTATHYTLSHKSTEMQEANSWSLRIFFFLHCFLVFALPLALRKGILQQLGLDQGAVAWL